MNIDVTIKDMISLRRQIRGLLSIIDLLLSRYNPICKRCFMDHGMVDECKCGKA